MSNLITFGKFEGETMEWLFFHKPWYAQWMYSQAIHRDRYKFSDEEGDHFRELMRRAWHLRGTCHYCQQRPITRMGLSIHHLSGALGHVDFYCEECEYTGGSITSYHRPSLFVDTHNLPKCEQKRIVGLIKGRYLGRGRLTQAKMEEFFHNDAHFVLAQPGFFTKVPLMEASG